MVKDRLTQNFIPITLKELLTQKEREGLDGDYEKFCIEINCTCSMYVE
jgi:hypothetical protein